MGPESMCMPSTTFVDIHCLMKEDLPTDLTMFLDLKKLTLFSMTVPCINGIGSCEYELCPMIESMADTLCNTFPPSQPCSCPLFANELDLKGIQLEVQDMGPILGPVMEGDYRYNTGGNQDRDFGSGQECES